jgi:hypothetical protein
MKYSLCNLITILLSIIPLNLWADNLTEKECRDQVKKELINRGLMTSDVCIDFSKESSFDVKFTNYELGENLDEKVSDNSDRLKKINNLFSPYSTDIQFEGYSDGVNAKFDSFDNSFLKPLTSGTTAYSVAGRTYSFVDQNLKATLDFDKIKTYIDGVKDTKSKDVLLKLYEKDKANANSTVTFKVDSSNNLTYQSPLLDVLRNHALAQSRATKLCESMMSPAKNCNNKDIGYPSCDLITQRSTIGGKENCGERRGARVKYQFPSPVKENLDHSSYIPEFKTPSHELQADMQLASSLSLMRKISALSDTDFPEKKATTDENLGFMKSEYYWDVAKDQQRFKKIFGETSSCSNNKYAIDESRRIYWANQRNLSSLRSQNSAIKDDPNYVNLFKSNQEFIDAVNAGDFSKIKDKFKDIYLKASDPTVQYANFNSSSKEELSQRTQFVILRSLLTGRPSDSDYDSLSLESAKTQTCKDHVRRTKSSDKTYLSYKLPLRTLQSEGTANLSKNELETMIQDLDACGGTSFTNQMKSVYEAMIKKVNLNTNQFSLNRYPNAPYSDPNKGSSIPSSAFDCLDASDAVAGYLKEYKGEDELSSMFRTGLKTGDDISLSYSDLNDVKIPGGTARGWLCGGCGSGVKVSSDGSVDWISRYRAAKGNEKVKSEADALANASNSSSTQELSIGSMKNLVAYEIACASSNSTDKCGCIKNVKNGAELRKLISTAKKINLTSKAETDTKFKLTSTTLDGKGCVFVPPVPHACSYNPNGNSTQQDANHKKEWGTFCRMLTKLTDEKSFPLLSPQPTSTSYTTIKTNCEKMAVKQFPKTEKQCAPLLNLNAPKATNSSGTNKN